MPSTLMPTPPPTPRIIEPPALIRGHPRGTGKWPLNSGWSLIRDEPLENLWGGGGWSTKKIFPQGNIKWKKNSCTLINPKKYSCYGLKKIHARNLITKKKILRLENSAPPPPITFLMARPLLEVRQKLA